MEKLVSFNEQEAQVILNLLDIACGSPISKPGGLQVALQASSITSKIMATFNKVDSQNVEAANSNGTD